MDTDKKMKKERPFSLSRKIYSIKSDPTPRKRTSPPHSEESHTQQISA